jgi:phosphoribosylformimino-5-aminoimidazole carboxamide ribotide isomerase
MRNLLIIPAIDMADGHCARCILGEPGTEQLYSEMSDHPVEIAQLWRRENAKAIHVTDTDSFAGRDDDATLQQVVAMQKAVDVPIEFVTFQSDLNVVRMLLEAGVYRVVVNIAAWTDPDGVRELMDEYGPSRVIFGMRSHNGRVFLGDDVGEVDDEAFIAKVRDLGGRRIIYSERDWEGALSGEDMETIQRVCDAVGTRIRLTMAGGIATPQQLWHLQEHAPANIDSVVIGRALYENRFPCQRIWRAVEAKLEPEIHAHARENIQQSSISRLGRTEDQ